MGKNRVNCLIELEREATDGGGGTLSRYFSSLAEVCVACARVSVGSTWPGGREILRQPPATVWPMYAAVGVYINSSAVYTQAGARARACRLVWKTERAARPPRQRNVKAKQRHDQDSESCTETQ